jgi:sugar diacid utilization regulator
MFKGGHLAVESAERLGLLGPCFAVVAAVPGADEDSVRGLLPLLRDLMSIHLSSGRQVPATIIDLAVYGVVSVPASAERIDGPLRESLSRLAERSRSVLRAGVMVGIGPVVRSASEVSLSRAHAEQVIRVLRAERRTGMADISDVASKALLLKVSDSLRNNPDLLSQPIKVLQQHDQENQSDYLPTLAAYLRAFGSFDVAAQELRVHSNTVRYRLRQIRNLTGLNLADPDERLALTLQLRLLAERGALQPVRCRERCSPA